MNKIKWIHVTLFITFLGFILTYIYFYSWRVALAVGIISGVITLFYNPSTRYMRAFWAVFSLLIGINSFSLKIISEFDNEYLSGKLNYESGSYNTILSIILVILCIILIILDYVERKNIKKPGILRQDLSINKKETLKILDSFPKDNDSITVADVKNIFFKFNKPIKKK